MCWRICDSTAMYEASMTWRSRYLNATGISPSFRVGPDKGCLFRSHDSRTIDIADLDRKSVQAGRPRQRLGFRGYAAARLRRILPHTLERFNQADGATVRESRG